MALSGAAVAPQLTAALQVLQERYLTTVTKEGNVAILTLNNPDKLNAVCDHALALARALSP